jgi:PncC family amidohydrolase
MSDAIAARVVGLLHERGETLTTAESLTGGGLGRAITTVPGASTVYLGGTIAYSNHIKRTHLGVSESTLTDYGAVSAECALEMAQGAVNRTGADWALSTTGVAGPDGQEGKPVGLVYVGVVGPEGVTALQLNLTGDREQVREQTIIAALNGLIDILDGQGDTTP